MSEPHDIFICFSEADGEFAQILEEALVHYRLPKAAGLHHRHLHIFLDSPELNNTEYADLMIEQLRRSRKMIVVCSPEARQDIPLNEKIRTFIATNGVENLVAVLAARTDIVPDDEHWLPEALSPHLSRSQVVTFAGVNFARPRLSRKCPRAWHHLLACLLDLDDATIAHIEAVQEKVWRRQRLALTIGLPLLFLIFLSGYWWFHHHSTHLELRSEKAGTLLHQARTLLSEGRHLEALHLLAAGFALEPQAPLRDSLQLRLYENLPAAVLRNLLPQSAPVTVAMLDSENQYILIGTKDGRVQIHNFSDGAPVFTPAAHDGAVTGLKLLANDRLITWSEDGTVQRRQWPDGRPVGPPLEHGAPVLGVCLRPDGSRMVSWGEDFTAQVWDLQTGRRRGIVQHQGWIGGAIFDPSGATFFTWSDDSTVRRWATDTVTPTGTAYRHKGAVNGARLSPDGTKLLTWGNDGVVQQWNLRTHRAAAPPLRHEDAVTGASYHPDGKTILSWSKDHTVRLWDAGTGREIRRFRHNGWVFGARFHPKKPQILSWSYDNSAKLWDLPTGQIIAPTMTHARPSLPGSKLPGIFRAALSADATRLLTADGAQSVQLWQLEPTTQLTAVFFHPPQKGSSLHRPNFFCNDDFAAILTWAADSTVKVWETRPKLPEAAQIPPKNAPALIRCITGTDYDTENGKLRTLSPQEWGLAREQVKAILSAR